MKEKCDLIIVVPVGPGVDPGFLLDSLMSVRHYMSCTYRIIIADDSQEGIGSVIKAKISDLVVIKTPYNYGRLCGLYLNLCMAFKYAIDNFHFRSVLKLDTDALVIGKNPQEEANELFQRPGMIGMAGQYPNDYEGRQWNLAWPRQRIINGTSTWKFIRRPIGNLLLRKYYKMALKNGYRTGESVFGGSYFVSEAFLLALDKNGLLPDKRFKSLNLEEDHLFSLLAKALGFGLGDLASGDKPFACAWKGLPDSPESLLKQSKKIIHSTRNWKDLMESDIRKYFSEHRAA